MWTHRETAALEPVTLDAKQDPGGGGGHLPREEGGTARRILAGDEGRRQRQSLGRTQGDAS